MAKKMYVGANVEPYLDNNNKHILVNTPIDYIPRTGFELDFTYLGGLRIRNIHQIINVGGVVGGTARTKFSFYADKRTNGVIFKLEYYDGTAKIALPFPPIIPIGVRCIVSFKVDMTQGLATYELKYYDTGEIIQKEENLAVDTTYTTSLGKVSIYNQELWDGSIENRNKDRSAYIKLYNLKLYDGETLVANYVPTGTNNSNGYLYDTISQQQLAYNEVCTEAPAIYKGGQGAEEVTKTYIGVNGEAKEIKKAYIGVNGQAKLFYEKV